MSWFGHWCHFWIVLLISCLPLSIYILLPLLLVFPSFLLQIHLHFLLVYNTEETVLFCCIEAWFFESESNSPLTFSCTSCSASVNVLINCIPFLPNQFFTIWTLSVELISWYLVKNLFVASNLKFFSSRYLLITVKISTDCYGEGTIQCQAARCTFLLGIDTLFASYAYCQHLGLGCLNCCLFCCLLLCLASTFTGF